MDNTNPEEQQKDAAPDKIEPDGNTKKSIPDETYEVPEQIREPVQMAMGEASMCWENPGGAGVFDSNRAAEIGDRLCQIIMKETVQETPAPTEGDVKSGGGDPDLKGYDPLEEVSPGPQNAITRADLPWQVVQLSESLPNDVTLVGYFMIGADHVLITDKGFFGLHEGSLSSLKVHVVVDNG